MVSLDSALAAAATLVAAAFALSTLDRWLAARRPHELAWTLALVMFVVASAALWFATAAGWSPGAFRVFYLFGAILNVPWLALGTVYLLAGRRPGNVCRAVLALASAFAAGVITVAPLKAPVPSGGLPKGSEVFGPLPRVMAAVGSGLGALVLLAGAILSVWQLVRGERRPGVADPRRLAIGNVLIAVGTLVLSASGTLSARIGALRAFEVTLLVGISVLFVGFLVATSASTTTLRAVRSPQDAPQDLPARAAR